MHILVAEDEPAIADFIQRGLAAEGYAVTVTGDGEDALRLCLTQDFALMILDRMLPGCDGLDVLAQLRPEKPGLPVIMLTARTGIDDRVAGLDAGAVDYMTKPRAFAPTCGPRPAASPRASRRSESSSTCSRGASRATASRSRCRRRSSTCS